MPQFHEVVDRRNGKTITRGTVVLVILLTVALAIAGFHIYRQDMIARYQNYAGDSIDFIARCIDGDDLEKCIETGVKSEKYEALQTLANDFKETHDLLYIFHVQDGRRFARTGKRPVLNFSDKQWTSNMNLRITDHGDRTRKGKHGSEQQNIRRYFAEEIQTIPVTFDFDITGFGVK